jgi:hypothetical protein
MGNLTTAQATRQAVSAQWALNQLGAQNYYNLCERFIENAYGTSGQYRSAAAASGSLMSNTDMADADVGDLVFFRPDASNGNYGHVGIYVGNGEMVSATNSGITRDRLDSPYWSKLLVGFGDPPDQWQGRSGDEGLLQGAANLVEKAQNFVGNVTGASKARATAQWGGAGQWLPQIAAAAEKYDIPVNLLAAKVNVESGGNPNATSPAGAKGLLQLMPATARGLGVTDVNDPVQNLDAGAKYFRQMYDQQGNWDDALRAYNAGPNGNWNNAETINHVKKVNQWADTIADAVGTGGGGEVSGQRGGEPPNVTRAKQAASSTWASFWDKLNQMNQDAQGAAAGIGSARDRFLRQRGSLPDPSALPRTSPTGQQSAAGQVGDFFSGVGSAVQGALSAGQRGQYPWGTGPGGTGPLFGGPGGGPGGGAPPSGPGGGPGGGPPGGGDIIDPTTGAPVSRSPMAPGVTGAAAGGGQPGGPGGGERKKPQGWVDPATISNPAYMGIIGQWNQALEAAQIAQDALSRIDPNDKSDDALIARRTAQGQLDKANDLVRGLAPTTANIIQAAEKEEGGQFAPGTSGKQKKFTIVKRNPQTGAWETQVIDNPAWEEDASIQTQRLSNTGALERQNAADKAALARTQAEIAGRQGISGAEIASREKISGAEIASREGIANLNATTSRVTTALNAAVQQRSQDIEAAIRAGDLSLREGTEQFNQWYKQNVEAPLAILGQQRQTEQYKVQAQEAITNRARGQSEHERGVANIGQQMWQGAAQAYNQMIPLTTGAGWGEGFQQNLTGQGYTPHAGASYNVPESLDAFATRKVAEMLKGVSPYAQNILSAQGQVGNPGQAMGGNDMTALTNQATGVASNALANPFVMPGLPQFQLPPSVDIAGIAGSGMDGNLTGQLDQYMPTYEYGGGNGQGNDMVFDNVDWTKIGQGVS